MSITKTVLTGSNSASNATTYTFTAVNLSTAAADRQIVVAGSGTGANNSTISSVTVAGITATVLLDASNGTTNDFIAIASVPTGTSGDIVVTFSAGKGRMTVMQPYACYGMASSATGTNSATPTGSPASSSTTVTVPAGGACFGVYSSGDSTTMNWTNLTEDFDQTVETQVGSAASALFASAQSPLTVTAAQASGSGGGGILGVVSFASSQTAWQGSSTQTGTGNLSAATIAVLVASASFAGAGNLSATARLATLNQATFAGSGNLSVNALRLIQAQTTFAGAGTLAVSGSLALRAAATFAGAGSLTADTIQKVATSSAQFNGACNLSATASLALRAATTFAGVGSLSALAALGQRVAATFAGAGNLSALAVVGAVDFATFAGAGLLSVATTANLATAAQFNGTGVLAANAITVTQIYAMFAGQGALDVLANQGLGTFVIFGGLGRFCIEALVRIGPPGATTNVVIPGPGPTNNRITYGVA